MMKIALCLCAFIASTSAQFLINYQYNVSDVNCTSSPNAVFANIASSNTATGAPCGRATTGNGYSRRVCNVQNPNNRTITENFYTDMNCTQATTSSTTVVNTECFLFNSSTSSPDSVPESVNCQQNAYVLTNVSSVVFTFYNDVNCNNIYGTYSYKANQCQIAEGGYLFILTSFGFTYQNFSDAQCSVSRSTQAANFTANNACSQITSQQAGFAPTLYFRTSSNINGPFAGAATTSGNSGNSAAATTSFTTGSTTASSTAVYTTYVGSTTNEHGTGAAASIIANVVLIVAAALAVVAM